jgi:hypothetical protein
MNKAISSVASVLCIVVVLGCGDESASTDRVSAVDGTAQSLHAARDCLTVGGALVPSKRDDLRSYARDLDRDQVEKPAGAGNGLATVAEYRPVLTYDPAKAPPRLPYIVYVGQPLGPDLNGITAMEDKRDDTFVVQMVQPTRRAIRDFRGCLDDFGGA